MTRSNGMPGSSIITLLAPAPPPARVRISAFIVSPLLHLVAFILILIISIKEAQPRNQLALSPTYIVRLLNLHTIQPPRRSVKDNTPRPAEHASRHLAAQGGIPQPPSILQDQPPSRTTLIQPDAPKVQLAQEIPLPTVVIWTPGVQKNINPPPLPPTPVPLVHPSIELPNTEQAVSDLNISATPFQTAAPMPLPSTISPLALHGQVPAGQLPQTTARASGAPSGARILSLSDLQMPEGTVVIPLANESAGGTTPGILLHGIPLGTAPAGNGKAVTDKEGGSAKSGQGDAGDQVADAGGAGNHNGTDNGAPAGADVSSGDGRGVPSTPTTTTITQPKNGRFEVVVVGTSVADEYPEAAKVWSGRMAYTVYLHVGVSKNWILQYSLPRSEEASVTGEAPRLNAPWPYVILRPNLVTPNTDGVMIHGLLNTAGKLEKLALVFPAEFADAKFILDSLRQWQFRPAMQSGQAAAVEILLIIPTDTE
jgi:hypothetical protein